MLGGTSVTDGGESDATPDVYTYQGFVVLEGNPDITLSVIVNVEGTAFKGNGFIPVSEFTIIGTTGAGESGGVNWLTPYPIKIVAPATISDAQAKGKYTGTLYLQEPLRRAADWIAREPTVAKATNTLRFAAQNPITAGGGSLPAWTMRRDWATGDSGLIWNEDDQILFPASNIQDGSADAPIPWLMFLEEANPPLQDDQALTLVQTIRLKLIGELNEPDFHAVSLDPRESQRLFRRELLIQEFAYDIKEIAHLTQDQAKTLLDYLTDGSLGRESGEQKFVYYDKPTGGDGYKQWEVKKEFRNSDNTLDFRKLIEAFNKNNIGHLLSSCNPLLF